MVDFTLHHMGRVADVVVFGIQPESKFACMKHGNVCHRHQPPMLSLQLHCFVSFPNVTDVNIHGWIMSAYIRIFKLKIAV